MKRIRSWIRNHPKGTGIAVASLLIALLALARDLTDFTIGRSGEAQATAPVREPPSASTRDAPTTDPSTHMSGDGKTSSELAGRDLAAEPANRGARPDSTPVTSRATTPEVTQSNSADPRDPTRCAWVADWPKVGVYEDPLKKSTKLFSLDHGDKFFNDCTIAKGVDGETYVRYSIPQSQDGVAWVRQMALLAR